MVKRYLDTRIQGKWKQDKLHKIENERTFDEECSNVWGYHLNIVIWNAHSPAREHLCHITSWPFPTNPQRTLMDCLSVWGDAVIFSSSIQSDSLSCIKMMISKKFKRNFCLPNIYYVFSNILYIMRLDIYKIVHVFILWIASVAY